MQRIFSIAMSVLLTTLLLRAAAAQEPRVQDLRAADIEQQRYFLIERTDAKKVPARGHALLLVLPGGDGSADFQPFVTNIATSALPEDYLVAQLVAVASTDPNETVWPTTKLKDKKQTFTTEQFIRNVVTDVGKSNKIDPRRVFALAWSSGGPAAYAASMEKETPIRGTFAAMSVFRQNWLPPLAAAKGQAYYIYHSEQDQTCPITLARAARQLLTGAGATCELVTYEGGHGWHGNVMADIRRGIDWLDKNAKLPTTAPTTRPTTRPH